MRTRSCYLVASCLLVLMSFGVALAGDADKSAEQATEKSLYERCGGLRGIAVVVDDLIDRLYQNETLHANPAIKAGHERNSPFYLKYRVTNMVCEATGGPQKYRGASMKESHAHLNITEEEWAAMMTEMKKSFEKFNVGQQEQKELIALVESVKPDIVMATSP